MRDSDPLALFIAASAIARRLAQFQMCDADTRQCLGVGYLDPLAAQIRPACKGPVILNSDFDPARAQAEIEDGIGDAVAFGRLFISNPDWPRRLMQSVGGLSVQRPGGGDL
ncbi:2,4-dienoyl-CoA reductase-like NADH-dependent reductase (Old Yellow Enzyme family) [Bradyrhizobium sp. USDA 3686]|uniref:hypothetical protein n=1 Tax=Bradyrhizobium TaxID=374 RepID=UPI00195B9B76|nr:hypothetical protein [Bradyrhizobium canariense]MBM7483945.1 2,4-dienoyl-CoA reductase-like NADH-dependent reductase (Old Yellow Enzyme family) [Bradyrhizobium canariense]UFW74859.1 hypothetical protein BcanWU425_14265 [Bradyrhizobium canariense]